MSAATSTCPVSRTGFDAAAKPLTVEVAGVPLAAEPRHFSTGSFGWHSNQKVSVKLPNGTLVACQVGLNITVIGSREAPAE